MSDTVDRGQSARYLTVAEVARKLNLSRSHIYRCIQSGTIPSIRLGRALRVPCRFLDEPSTSRGRD